MRDDERKILPCWRKRHGHKYSDEQDKPKSCKQNEQSHSQERHAKLLSSSKIGLDDCF